MSESHKFATFCPCEKCEESDEVIYWNHHCGGSQKIDEQGFIYCDNCQKRCHLADMVFSCGKDNTHKPYFDKNNRYYDYIKMIIKAPYLSDSFKRNIIISIMEHYKKHT